MGYCLELNPIKVEARKFPNMDLTGPSRVSSSLELPEDVFVQKVVLSGYRLSLPFFSREIIFVPLDLLLVITVQIQLMVGMGI